MSDLKVFLSSTWVDLAEHRRAVFDAISKTDGYTCIRMEDFGSAPEIPKNKCIQEVAKCDVFVCILGYRYGDYVKGTDISFTEIEYVTAKDRDIPILLHDARDDMYVSPKHRETDDRWNRIKQFRQRAKETSVADFFSTPHELATNVITSLHNFGLKSGLAIEGKKRNNNVIIVESTDNVAVQMIGNTRVVNGTYQWISSKPTIIKKIHIFNPNKNNMHEYDFTKKELPRGVTFSRTAYAYYPSGEIAESDKPRFVDVDKGCGLLVEPAATNLLHTSQFNGTQVVELHPGLYTVYFESDKEIELSGIVTAKVFAKKPITFNVFDEEKNSQLIIKPEAQVSHFQLEHGKHATSKLVTTGTAVSRDADVLTFDLSR